MRLDKKVFFAELGMPVPNELSDSSVTIHSSGRTKAGNYCLIAEGCTPCPSGQYPLWLLEPEQKEITYLGQTKTICKSAD